MNVLGFLLCEKTLTKSHLEKKGFTSSYAFRSQTNTEGRNLGRNWRQEP